VWGQTIDRTVLRLFAAWTLPGVGELAALVGARRGPERMVTDMLRLCCVDLQRIDATVLEAHLELARARHGSARANARDFLRAQRSLLRRLFQRGRFFRMAAAVRAPTLIVQGERDRLVDLAAARALAAARPDWGLEVFPDVGHVPMLERPGRFLEVVGGWLAAVAAQGRRKHVAVTVGDPP
jgi:pimeloyl-ACP methyl ester carboxylesterase